MDVRLALSRSSPHPLDPRPVHLAGDATGRGDLPGALRPMRTRLVRSRRDCNQRGPACEENEPKRSIGPPGCLARMPSFSCRCQTRRSWFQ